MRFWIGVSFSFVALSLFTWQLIEYYRASLTLSGSEGTFFFLNLTPGFLLFILMIPYGFYLRYMTKKNKVPLKELMLIPPEFKERDEREKEITAKACRASYMSMFYIYPVLAAFLIVYPLIQNVLPYLPIVLVMVGPLLQIFVYLFTWRKANTI
ncbi:hypothetical protein [Shouchella patagoniensis]|uniref:hypothetical protein n=1 Tax=Shouchella patagoniensis TaxID=228576 RepID=UPI000995C3B2|nr:hypothetical protein [Shouchella patagoniensis]